MPELPEVETVMRGLVPHLVGRTITAVNAYIGCLRQPIEIERLRSFCIGRTVSGLRRRAKYIVVQFDNASGILLHLGMSGAFRIEDSARPSGSHDRVSWELDNGLSWRFSDIRRFGSVVMCSPLVADEFPTGLAHLGPEPLDAEFTGEFLYRVCRGRSRPIKSLIMDQAMVVGIGNIYANEALFRAGIHPGRNCSRLSRRRCDILVDAVKAVLREAIEVGGTTISTYRGVDGSEGRFRVHLDVYGHAGMSCPRCGPEARIRRCVLGGRSTFYCPGCQH